MTRWRPAKPVSIFFLRRNMYNPWRGLGGLPREIWILFCASLVNRAGMMVLPMLIIYLTRELALSPARAGFVLSVYGITAIVVGPISGAFSDRFGPIKLMRLSLLVSGSLILFYPLARTYQSVILITIAWASAAELFRPSSMSAITSVVAPDQRKAAFAVHRLAINLGMSIGPALGGFLAAVSFRLMFRVDGITSIIAGVILALTTWGVHASASDASDSGIPTHESVFEPAFLGFLAAAMLVGIVFFQHIGAMPLFIVQKMHLSPAFFGILFTINTMLIVVFEVPATVATSHWPNRTTMIVASLLFAFGFGALAFVTSPAGVIATVVVWTVGEMLLFPAMASHMGDVAPPDRRGTYMGAYSMSMSAALAVGPWLGTALFQKYGSATVWVTMFGIGLAAAALVAVATPKLRPSPAVAAGGS